MPTFIPFDGWTPGGGAFGEGWPVAQNVVPWYGDVRPMRKFVEAANSINFGPMTGTYAHTWMTGAGGALYYPDEVTLFAGSKTRLFTVNVSNGTGTNVSRAANYGGGASEPAGWKFVSVGNDVWASNWSDPMQRRVNNAGLFTDGVTSTFTPTPRFLAVIREHLVVANLSNAGRFQDELAWSDADNATNFDPPTGASTSLAGAKRLISTPGQITGLVGGQYGLAFKRKGIYYLEYAGPPSIFRPDVLSPHHGTAFPGSVINTRYGVFFLDADGFYQIQGLGAPTKVSTPGVDRFLLDIGLFGAPPGFITASQEDKVIWGFQLPNAPLIGWAYSSLYTDSIGHSNALLYNPVSQQWTYALLDPTPSVLASMPYSSSPWAALKAFAWNGTQTSLAKWSESGVDADIQAPTLQLRYRPVGFERASKNDQRIIEGVLPVFSKVSPFTVPALQPSITVESALDPFATLVWKTETRSFADKDTISGMYPFQITGRFFKISISCNSSDFANFEGVWVYERALT